MHVEITVDTHGSLLRIPTREQVVEFEGGMPIEKTLHGEYVCDLHELTGIELDGVDKVTLTYPRGEQNEFRLHEDTALEFGKLSVPVANVVAVRLVREDEPSPDVERAALMRAIELADEEQLARLRELLDERLHALETE